MSASNLSPMIKAVIFDADDTLWITEPLYERSLDLVQAEVERNGIDGAEWRRVQGEIDVAAVGEMGFSVERFPTSSVKAYRQLADPSVISVEHRVYELSCTVFNTKADLVPAADEVLGQLQSTYLLAMITKGERYVQRKRIEDSALGHYFDASLIVQHKSLQTFGSMCDLLEVMPSESASVGNSLKSDIFPAVEAGLRGVWIDAEVWQHEHHHPSTELPSGVTELGSLEELPEHLEAVRSSA